MTIAWRDFLLFAIEFAPIREDYLTSTGRSFVAAPKSQIDAMIDNATGQAETEAQEFMLWVTAAHWGVIGVPADVLALIADRRAQKVPGYV